MSRPTTSTPQVPGDGRPRVALAVRVFDRRALRFVIVVNLHGLRDAREDGGDFNLLGRGTLRPLAALVLTDP